VRVQKQLRIKYKAQNLDKRAGVKGKGEQLEGGGGKTLLLLYEVNMDIFVRGKMSTMHVSPCQAALANVIWNRTSFLSALTKSQKICIIN
jgi:hypothetical protein